MRHGHGPHGIVGITMKPSALKKWAYSMHTCSQIVHDLTDMSESHMVAEVTIHKEEKASSIRSDEEDREKIRESSSPISILSIWPIIRIGSITLSLAELGQRM